MSNIFIFLLVHSSLGLYIFEKKQINLWKKIPKNEMYVVLA